MDSPPARRPSFLEEDDGLASLAEMEAGFSGNHHNHLLYRPLCYSLSPLKSSLRNMSFSSVSSPRSGRFYDGRFEEHQPHFLDACFLCKKPLGDNRDIFMYRGDTPFCSEECREEQIEMDEAKEKNLKLSTNMKKALRKKDHKDSTSPNKNSPDYTFHTGTVVAA